RGRAARLWPHVPNALLGSHPQRDRHGHHGRRQHLRAGPRQLHPDGGTRRSMLPGAAPSRRSLLDAPCRGSARPCGRRLAQALPCRPRSAQSAGRACRSGRGARVMRALADKHALITGGGSGIGAAIAGALAAGGAAVSIAGRRMGPLKEVAARIAGAMPIVADVTREEACQAMVAAARAAHGPIDILIANAGAAESAPAAKADLPHWQRMIDVNLTGAFLSARAALPDLTRDGTRDGEGRRIVFIASTAGLTGYPY